MANAYQRKKQPELVRQALVDSAARLAAQLGPARLTVQAVAQAAGVTKGGLFHHFPTKKALLDAVYQNLLAQLDAQIAHHLAQDTTAHGRFTRAYVAAILGARHSSMGEQWMALSLAMATEPAQQHMWADWLSARLAHHRDTDSHPQLEVVRLAADGAWLILMSPTEAALLPNPQRLHQQLRALTLQG